MGGYKQYLKGRLPASIFAFLLVLAVFIPLNTGDIGQSNLQIGHNSITSDASSIYSTLFSIPELSGKYSANLKDTGIFNIKSRGSTWGITSQNPGKPDGLPGSNFIVCSFYIFPGKDSSSDYLLKDIPPPLSLYSNL
jgi:hypothetical protein